MDDLYEIVKVIKPINKNIQNKALARLRQQARPEGSLGYLEELSVRLASISGSIDVHLKNKKIITCAGDHGVVDEGVSLFPQETTGKMVLNFVNGGASINVLANHAKAEVLVADFGVNFDFKSDLPIFHKKVRKGTSNFTKGKAMTRSEAISSITKGIEIINELKNKNHIDIIATGDMGIGNTTPSTAIIAVFSGEKVENLTGRGTGLNDEGLKNKISVIKRGLELHKPDPKDPIDVLSKIGGFEIGGIAGLVLGAALNGIPVVTDGLISTAGAILACELAPTAKEYLFVGHKSTEIGHQVMYEYLGIKPILDLGLRLGEGTGAALALEILDASTRVLSEIKTFEEVEIVDSNLNS